MEKKMSLIATMAAEYSMEPQKFAQTIRSTVMPAEHTEEQFAAFLMVAHRYGLNPLLREIYAFPTKGGGIQSIVGLDGYIRQMNSHADFDGMDMQFNDSPDGKPISCTAVIYRKSRSHPTVVTEYLEECRRPTEPWQKWPRRMLRHKAMIQAIRIAFGVTGVSDEPEEPDMPEMHVEASVASVEHPLLDTVKTTRPEPEQHPEPPVAQQPRVQPGPPAQTTATPNRQEVVTTQTFPYWDHLVMCWRDAQGVAFDKEVHSELPNGMPSMTDQKLFRAKKGMAIRAEELRKQALAAQETPTAPTVPAAPAAPATSTTPAPMELIDVLQQLAAAETLADLEQIESKRDYLSEKDKEVFDPAFHNKYQTITRVAS